MTRMMIFIAALLLCGGLTRAEGGQGMNLENLDPANVCPKACAEGCTLEASACVDIPNVLDCAAEKTRCDKECSEVCGCLAGCKGMCQKAVGDCQSAKGLQMLACNLKQAVCIGQCESQCESDEITKTAESELKILSGMLQGLMKKLTDLLKGMGGAVGGKA